MSIQPGQHNITVQRRADYDLPLQFKNSAGVGINLTGWTAYAQVWDQSRTTKHADFAVTYVDRVTGQIKIALTDTQTAAFPNEAFYDVLLEDTAGLRNYYLEGVVYVSQGYTQPAA
jgi:hypothetical protein